MGTFEADLTLLGLMVKEVLGIGSNLGEASSDTLVAETSEKNELSIPQSLMTKLHKILLTKKLTWGLCFIEHN